MNKFPGNCFAIPGADLGWDLFGLEGEDLERSQVWLLQTPQPRTERQTSGLDAYTTLYLSEPTRRKAFPPVPQLTIPRPSRLCACGGPAKAARVDLRTPHQSRCGDYSPLAGNNLVGLSVSEVEDVQVLAIT